MLVPSIHYILYRSIEVAKGRLDLLLGGLVERLDLVYLLATLASHAAFGLPLLTHSSLGIARQFSLHVV